MIIRAKGEERAVIAQKEIDIWLGRWAKIFMAYSSTNSNPFCFAHPTLFRSLTEGGSPVAERVLAPLAEILPKLQTTRECPELPDEDWLTIGVLRVLHEVKSGRGFLQEVGAHLPNCPDFNHFFATLRSERRLAFCREAETLLSAALRARLPDTLAAEEELADFDIYAGDGHWHGAAAHDHRPFAESPKPACGHFFALDLRRGLLHHITAADQVEREHEHDMRALQRQTIEALRRGARKGRKVFYVWDRAGINFRAWKKWKQRGGIYFLSREKDNMTLRVIKVLPWEASDARNAGVQSDEQCQSSCGELLRRVVYEDPVSLTTHVFLTNEMTLPPGLIAELGRRRWNIEKVFDELKNKLGETKAWATSAPAKSMQAVFFCLTHQLLLAFEHLLDEEHGIRPDAELARRAQRIENEIQMATQNNRAFPSLRAATLRLTQRTVKLLRWLRSSLSRQAPWLDLIALLRHSYASG